MKRTALGKAMEDRCAGGRIAAIVPSTNSAAVCYKALIAPNSGCLTGGGTCGSPGGAGAAVRLSPALTARMGNRNTWEELV